MRKERIENALIEMGAEANTKGFSYITQAILFMEKETQNPIKLEILYEMIGKSFRASPGSVERAIRHCFKMVRHRDGCGAVKHYIGYVNCGNSASLSQLLLMIKREEENEESNT